MRSPTEKSPEDYGWSLIEGKYEYYWFDGPQSPSFEELSSSEFQGTLSILFLFIDNYFIIH